MGGDEYPGTKIQFLSNFMLRGKKFIEVYCYLFSNRVWPAGNSLNLGIEV